MGNFIQQNNAFDWHKQFQIVQNNLHDQYLLLRSLQSEQEFIGKEISCHSLPQINHTQLLISSKIGRPCQNLTKLVWTSKNNGLQYCSYQIKYYLLFQKHYLNLKQFKINRQFKCQGFSQSEVLEVLQSVMKALLFLKKIGQPHQRLCLQNIYIKDDKSLVLSDPWLFSKEFTSIYSFHLNGFIYPSPEKILYENHMIQEYDKYVSDYYSLGVLLLQLLYMQQMDLIYEKGFRKILEESIKSKINMVNHEELKTKLKILLSYDPQQRRKIEKFYGRQAAETQICFVGQKNNLQNTSKQPFQKKEGFKTLKDYPKIVNAQHVKQQTPAIATKNNNIPINLKSLAYSYSYCTPGNIRNMPKIHFSYSQKPTFQPLVHYQLVKPIPMPEQKELVSSGTNTSPMKKGQVSVKIAEPASQTVQLSFDHKQNIEVREQHANSSQFKMISTQKNLKEGCVNSQVNNSLSDMNLTVVKNSLSEENQSQEPLQKIYQIRQLFKEVISLNASDDRSQRASQVIGHGFSSFNQQPNSIKNEVQGRGSLPSYSRKESLDRYTNRQSKSCANLQQLSNDSQPVSSSSIQPSIQSIPIQTKLQVPAITPERAYPVKKFNSTIKQVSQDQNSVSSYDNQLDQRTVEYDVGTKYIGQIKGGKRNGKGLFYYSDGSYYQGYWKDNKMHGKGCLYYSNGSLAYDGSWYMDNFHGKGKIYNDHPKRISYPFDYKTMTNEDIQYYWEVYDGDFFYEQKYGKGKLKLANGEVYVGEFSDDVIHGYGRFYRLNGDIVSGKWNNGHLVQQI